MLELIILLIFCLSLIFCVAIGLSVIYSLLFGLGLFIFYARLKGHGGREILYMCLEGIFQMKTILIIFVLIGMITASWKASGSIAYIIVLGSKFISAKFFILASFFLCSFLSVLIGTSFGTAATMGVICISMARGMGIDERIVGGAIISGIFYGDRCSPMSSAALLVAQVTKTDIFENIKGMIKTSIGPTIITIFLYYVLGLKSGSGKLDLSIIRLIEENFILKFYLVLPALIIILFSILKINVLVTMAVSIVCALVFSFTVQGYELKELIAYLFFGYLSDNASINELFKGGGVFSMLNPAIIITIAACYSGIFEKTGLLNGLKSKVNLLAVKTNDFFAVFSAGLLTSIISCNQSLATILTYQLCKSFKNDKSLAIDIGNTTILIAAWIPWSIALAVPSQSLGLDPSIVVFAFYLYVLPIYHLFLSLVKKKI